MIDYLSDIMMITSPYIYRNCDTIKNKGETVIYVKAINTIYVIMKVELLFYKNLFSNITNIGFKLEPYDPCVANKVVKSKQITVVCHVDYLKVVHESNKIFASMAKWLKKTYERVFEDGLFKMKIHIDKIRSSIGMNLDFSSPGEVKVTMIPYIG